MIWVHVWRCGRFVWAKMTVLAAAKLPHLTPAAVAAKVATVAKVVAVGGAVYCSQAVVIPSTPADYLPPTVGREAIPLAGPIGQGVDLRGIDFRRSGLVPAPEPGAAPILLVGVVGVITARRLKTKRPDLKP